MSVVVDSTSVRGVFVYIVNVSNNGQNDWKQGHFDRTLDFTGFATFYSGKYGDIRENRVC